MPLNDRLNGSQPSMISYLLKKVDMFELDLPTFNLKGKSKVASVCGGLVSVVIITIMLLYSGIKLTMLVNRENPNVSTFSEEFVLSSEDKLNLKEAGMLFAWTFEGYGDK